MHFVKQTFPLLRTESEKYSKFGTITVPGSEVLKLFMLNSTEHEMSAVNRKLNTEK